MASMAELDVDAFVEALKSETIVLVIDNPQQQQHQLPIAKALLSHKSHWFAKLLSKPGYLEAHDGKIETSNIGLAVAKMFVYWCYHERLPPYPDNASPAISKQWKELLIDLWLFGDTYGVPVLQNQVMTTLSKLFGTGVNLTVDDVKYMHDRTLTTDSPLRHLAVFRAVAQLESLPAKKGRGLEDFKESLCHHADFAVKAYEVVKMWIALSVPQKNMKDKWTVFLQQGDVQKVLKVSETQVEVQTPLPPPPSPANVFAPGEVIMIDDD